MARTSLRNVVRAGVVAREGARGEGGAWRRRGLTLGEGPRKRAGPMTWEAGLDPGSLVRGRSQNLIWRVERAQKGKVGGRPHHGSD